ncbi:unnamed protein product [Prorocentrum cordatum]|uniref:D-glutamate cyclase-like C-terminal domain-containing protein n=1 Tax=Prorocentrum cordatum TaxID=2364126 RepID=A0ABN9SVA6_9DINO|nr:unnamed protein product [Polarella glacialis]
MGKVAHLEGVAQLKPAGNAEFVPLSANGCYRSCDHLVLSTVSNWGGSAFEAAAHALLGPGREADYLGEMRGQGSSLQKHALLAAITSAPAGAVDGIDPQKARPLVRVTPCRTDLGCEPIRAP